MITEHEFQQALKSIARQLKHYTKMYLADRKGLIRKTGIDINPDYSSFNVNISCWAAKHNDSDDITLCISSDYYAGGVCYPSIHINENVAYESEDFDV